MWRGRSQVEDPGDLRAKGRNRRQQVEWDAKCRYDWHEVSGKCPQRAVCVPRFVFSVVTRKNIYILAL